MKKQTLILITIPVLTICFGIAFYALGWTNPTANPPSGNVYTPINTGPVGQSKEGGLIINTGGAGNGLVVQTGNVGIGTNSPNRALSVVSADSDNHGKIFVQGSGGGPFMTIGADRINTNATFFLQNLYSHNLSLVSGGGNVGIGTASPIAKLSVIGESIYLGGNNSWGTSIMNHNDSSGNTWRWVTGGGTGDGNVPAGGMAFHKDGAFSPLQIKNDGTIFMNTANVGIGTTNPLAKLEVHYVEGGRGIESVGPTGNSHFPWTDGNIYISGEDIVFRNSSNAVKMMIDGSTGNVGIGTSSPSQKLEVVGGPIKATGGLIIETRTNDPVNPETGRMWLRTDL